MYTTESIVEGVREKALPLAKTTFFQRAEGAISASVTGPEPSAAT